METPLKSSVLSCEILPLPPSRSEQTTSHHENCGVGWSITHCSTMKTVNREMLAMCSFPFCRSTEAAQRGMTRRFGTRWIRRWKQDGRSALHRHDLNGRDHDRHHGWRAPCNEGSGPARTREDLLQHISIQQPLKKTMQFFAESVCRDNAVLDLRLSTTKRLMGSACLRRGGKTRRRLGATSTSTSHSSMRRMEQEEPAARTASIHQSHDLFSGTIQDRRCACIVPMMR